MTNDKLARPYEKHLSDPERWRSATPRSRQVEQHRHDPRIHAVAVACAPHDIADEIKRAWSDLPRGSRP
jgi:hypothetical protein